MNKDMNKTENEKKKNRRELKQQISINRVINLFIKQIEFSFVLFMT